MIYFSVVLPAFNTPPDILRRAINSVLNQTYPYFELIIVDDGSEPSLDTIVKEYTDERIIYIRHKENKGAGAAHNTGIKAAKYEWIAFICHDDEWLNNKLEICKEVIEKEKKYKIFFHKVNEINDKKIFKNITYYTGNYYKNYLFDINRNIQTSAIIVNRECFSEVGLYDETGVLIDWDLYLRMSKRYDFYCINNELSNYYYSPLGITHENTIMKNPDAGNDVFKLYIKWKKEIRKYKLAKKNWSMRFNAMAYFYTQNHQFQLAWKLYKEAFLLNPFWYGNYIDIFKFLFISRKLR
ncbi:MAG: glycosyltransferase family 2 protein [Bacteroidales bacterium]|nr:glycosyltransferase family 2 protein [Bacteroidales bacterium]